MLVQRCNLGPKVSTRDISRNLKLGGYRQLFGGRGVNMREAQVYIEKH